MFYQIFILPQVKRCVIITEKHGIYEFLTSCRTTSDLTSYRKLGDIRKVSKPHKMIR